VIEKALFHVKVCDDLPDYILLAKTIIKVLARMMKALDENKHSNSGVKLATKHALLTITIIKEGRCKPLVFIIETLLQLYQGEK
jgi:hypothetical protein